VSCSYSSSPTSQVITVSSVSSGSISSSFFSIANVLIPPTVGSSESISMYSQWSERTDIDAVAT
jgi:hypothetical protein